MSRNQKKVFVTEKDQQRYSVLFECGDVGLPFEYRWGISRNGPYHSFSFRQLADGIVDVQNSSPTSKGRGELELRCFGTYSFESPLGTTIAQVCVDVGSGIVLVISSTNRLEFLNSSIRQLAQSLEFFQELRDTITAGSATTREAEPIWKKFESNMRVCDPDVFEELDSFWGTLIGEFLEDGY